MKRHSTERPLSCRPYSKSKGAAFGPIRTGPTPSSPMPQARLGKGRRQLRHNSTWLNLCRPNSVGCESQGITFGRPPPLGAGGKGQSATGTPTAAAPSPRGSGGRRPASDLPRSPAAPAPQLQLSSATRSHHLMTSCLEACKFEAVLVCDMPPGYVT